MAAPAVGKAKRLKPKPAKALQDPDDGWVDRWWAFWQSHGGGTGSSVETWRKEIAIRLGKHGSDLMELAVRGAAADPWASGKRPDTADSPPIRGIAWMLRDATIRDFSDRWLNREGGRVPQERARTEPAEQGAIWARAAADNRRLSAEWQARGGIDVNKIAEPCPPEASAILRGLGIRS